MLVAVIGIGSVAFLNRDQGGTPGSQSSQVTTGFTVNTFVASTTAADTTTAASTTTTAAVTDASVSAAAYYSTAPAVSTESVSTSQTTEVSTSTAETTDTTAVTSVIDTDTQTTSAETTEPENVTTTVPAELPFKEGVWIGETSEAGSKRQCDMRSSWHSLRFYIVSEFTSDNANCGQADGSLSLVLLAYCVEAAVLQLRFIPFCDIVSESHHKRKNRNYKSCGSTW